MGRSTRARIVAAGDDGEEALVYDLMDTDPANHGYRDPLDGPCFTNLFADGFESGDTSRWSSDGSE